MRKTLKHLKAVILIAGSLFMPAGSAFAAGTLYTLSTAGYSTAGSDNARGVAVDPSGNIIVTGTSGGMRTIKYNSNLVGLAAATESGSFYGQAVAVDASGNIIVTGNSISGLLSDYFTIKYNSDLVVIASTTYNGSADGHDYANGVAVDASGNIIVTGRSVIGSTDDYFTIKYSSNLVVLSSAAYNSPGDGHDNATGVAVDASGNIIVTGYIFNGSSNDYFTIKYDPNLVVLASAACNGPADSEDFAEAVAADASGNIIVTGRSSDGSYDDYFTIKYNSNLVVLASATYNGPLGHDDVASGVAVDARGNIIVTGQISGETSPDYCTIKYDPNLVILAVGVYNAPIGGYDHASGVAVDASGNIIVTGVRTGATSQTDYFTIKYNGAPPAVTAFSPAYGERGKTLEVTVTGSNFLPGAGVSFSGTGITVNSATRDSATRLRASITIAADAAAGKRDVIVTNTDATTVIRPQALEVAAFETTSHIDSPYELKLYLLGGGEITVSVPPASFSQAVDLTVKTAVVPASTDPAVKPSAVAFEVSKNLDLQPLKTVTMTVKYLDADIAGLDESKLAVCRYDEASGAWVPLPSTINAAINTVTAATNHLSTFVLAQLTPSADLSGVKAYPNPFNPQNGALTLANLTGEADIRIYNVAGELVRTLSYTSATGIAAWDGKNDGGNPVASGIYLAFIKSPQSKKIIKIAVER